MAKVSCQKRIYEMINERIIGLLEKGEVPWRKPWVSGEPVNFITRKPYRGAIEKPSPLSDIYLGEISGRPLLVKSWAKSHSNEAPPLFSPEINLEKLKTERLLPEIFLNRLKMLENRSGRPFLKQWAYEYQRIIDTLGEQSDGHISHFIQNDRQRSFGHFISRRGHMARSAYLRTLSLAFDNWEMPEELTLQEATYATPIDLTFLKMLPGEPPSWTDTICNSTSKSPDEWQNLLSNIVTNLSEGENAVELLHLNLPLSSTVHYQAEVELVSCLYMDKEPKPKDVFNLYQFLPGKAELPRTSEWEISNPQQAPGTPFPGSDGGFIFPTLIPTLNRYVGYLQMEMLQRIPHLPANYSGAKEFKAKPRRGGMDLLYSDKLTGEVRFWNWRWSPTFDKVLGPHCGTCLTISKDFYNKITDVPDATFARYWRATVLKREKEHSEWKEETLMGRLQ